MAKTPDKRILNFYYVNNPDGANWCQPETFECLTFF